MLDFAMKTTLDLPDDLVRAMKLRAVQEGKKLKYLAAELLRKGLEQPVEREGEAAVKSVKLPLVHCAHAASPEGEVTPERAAEILLNQEADAHHEASR